MTLRSVCAACLLTVGACAGQISGEVDDGSVPGFGEAFYFAYDVPFFGFHHAEALLATYGDACRVTTELEDERRDARAELDQAVQQADGDEARIAAARDDWAERMDENDRALLPAEYWTATIGVNAEDDDDLEGESFTFDPDILPEATLTICHQQDYPNYDDIADGDDDDDRDCFVANDGTLEVTLFDDEQMQGQGEAELVELRDQNNNAGDVQVSFGAKHCEDYEDLVD